MTYGVGERRKLILWGSRICNDLHIDGEIWAANFIAAAVAGKDYETLDELRGDS